MSKRHQQPCAVCLGSGECRNGCVAGDRCELCFAHKGCPRCEGAGRETAWAAVNADHADHPAWSRAELFNVDLFSLPGSLHSTLACIDKLLQCNVSAPEQNSDAETLLSALETPQRFSPQAGAQYLASGDFGATSGVSFFAAAASRTDPSTLLEVHIVELNLVRTLHLQHGRVCIVEVEAVHRLDSIAPRIGEAAKLNPAGSLHSLLTTDAPFDHFVADGIVVLHRSLQEAWHWIALQRSGQDWRLVLEFVHIGGHQFGALGSWVLGADDMERFGFGPGVMTALRSAARDISSGVAPLRGLVET